LWQANYGPQFNPAHHVTDCFDRTTIVSLSRLGSQLSILGSLTADG